MGILLSLVKNLMGIGAVEGVVHLQPVEAQERLKGLRPPQLVDVRTSGEYSRGNIENSKNIPLQELESRLGELDKTRPILLYCMSGHRSGLALSILKARGFTDIGDIVGGVLAWRDDRLPIKS